MKLSIEKKIIIQKKPEKKYKRELSMLINEIKGDVKYIVPQLKKIGKTKLDEKVYKAIEKVPRHKFVDEKQRGKAYKNFPLAIGYGQTISQPLIVALMTDLLDVQKEHKILEIGTGSAYQAAVLSQLVKSVYSIEIIEELGKKAIERVKHLAYKNIHIKLADGYYGLKSQAPFDGIIVTAAASHVPKALIKQLKVGGKMVIPIGNPLQVQNLLLIEKTGSKIKDLKETNILPVRFVPFEGIIKND